MLVSISPTRTAASVSGKCSWPGRSRKSPALQKSYHNTQRPFRAVCFPAKPAATTGHLRATTSELDVAIIGAGAAGAAAACSILTTSPNLRVKVFDSAAELKPLADAAHLHGNGLSALQAIDEGLRASVEGLLLPDGPLVAHLSSGQQIAAVPSLVKRYPGTNGLIPWHELQSALLQQLPPGTLQLGRTLEAVSTSDNKATLQFQGSPTVTAKVVLGCDGYQSTVRTQLLGSPSLQYFGPTSYVGTAKPPPDWPHHGNVATSWVSPQQGVNILMARLRGGRVFWDVTALQRAPAEGTGQQQADKGMSGSGDAAREKLQQLLDSLADSWPEDMLVALRTTDPVTFRESDMPYREPEDCQVWGRGPVTLLGDAAHMGGPSLGQKLNQALEDGVEAGRAIGELGPTEAALRRYESVRQPRALRVQGESVQLTKGNLGGQPAKESQWNEENGWCIGHTVAPLPQPVARA